MASLLPCVLRSVIRSVGRAVRPGGRQGVGPGAGPSGLPGTMPNLAWSVVIRGSCSDAREDGQHLVGPSDLGRDRGVTPVPVVVPPFALGQAHGPRGGTS